MQIGAEQLTDWMRRRGFNFTEAAAYLGWDLTFVSKLANGHRLPGLTNAIHLERLCGIPVEAWLPTAADTEAEPVGAGRGKRR